MSNLRGREDGAGPGAVSRPGALSHSFDFPVRKRPCKVAPCFLGLQIVSSGPRAPISPESMWYLAGWVQVLLF